MKLDKFGKKICGYLALVFSHFGVAGLGILQYSQTNSQIVTTVVCLLGATFFGGIYFFSEDS